MPDQHTLEETERATSEKVGHLSLNFGAMQAVSSIYRAANSARSHLTNTVLRRHDLTWTGFLVLWLLWIWDRMETRRVAENVGISKATLTGVTNTLVSRGLVRRVPSTVDRRLVGLELTPEGSELMETLFPEFNNAEAQIVSELDPEQVQNLTVALRQIVSTVEERVEDSAADTRAASTES
jgi:MarR family transcriptional regulator, organic hydroperoxide resistance regulator